MNDLQIKLNGFIIPVYKDKGGEVYYPIKYVIEQFLLKNNGQLYKKEEYKRYIIRCKIDWSFKGTSIQECYCMNADGWKLYLNNMKTNKRKTDEKIKKYNELCKYFGLNECIIDMDKPIIDDFTQYCIDEYINNHIKINWNTCSDCGRKFPISNNFFIKDSNCKHGFTNVCKICKSSTHSTTCNDDYINLIYKTYENGGFNTYLKDRIDFYNTYCHNKDFKFKGSDEEQINIIKWYYDNKLISAKDLNRIFLDKTFNFKIDYKITINSLNEILSNNECKIRPWLYPTYKLGNIDVETAKEIIYTYLKDNSIHIDNIFTYNYNKLLKNCRLTQFLDNLLDFIVKFNDYKYAGYKFKTPSSNYYKDKNNRIFDIKYLIEQDLKLDITKIPLYITKTFLSENYAPLYLILNKSYYSGSIFKWIDECYPNKFEEQDFDITKYRMEFDSFEEGQVDRILREKLGKSVIYNIRNSKNEISVLGMKPDWIIISNIGTVLVEYFGMYLEHGGKEFKERLKIYKDKTELKFEKYGELMRLGYKHLYIYPSDLKNNFEGLYYKLNKIFKI